MKTIGPFYVTRPGDRTTVKMFARSESEERVRSAIVRLLPGWQVVGMKEGAFYGGKPEEEEAMENVPRGIYRLVRDESGKLVAESAVTGEE